MTEIIRNWLTNRLGILLDNDLRSFGEINKDGTLITQLLHNYGVIHAVELSYVVQSDDPKIVFQNFKWIRLWLKKMGMKFSENTISLIICGNGTECVRLYYELYLHLNSRSKVDFKFDQNKSPPKIPTDRFTLETVTERQFERSVEVADACRETEAALEWHRNKYKELMEKTVKMREIHRKNLNKRVNKQTRKPSKASIKYQLQYEEYRNKKSLDTYKYDYVIRAKKLENIVSCNDPRKADEFLTDLKQKHRKEVENKLLQLQTHKMLLAELLNSLTKKQDKEFQHHIGKKLLKQSDYEKQMTSKLLEVRNQKDIIIDNRILENERIAKERDKEFIQQLFQHEFNLSMQERHYLLEKQRKLELHRKLFTEKKRREYVENYNFCLGICDDLIILALRTIEFEDNFEVCVPMWVWKEWMKSFSIGIPLQSSSMEDLTELVQESAVDVDPDITFELYRQNKLDEKDFYDYIHLYWPWNIEEPADYYETCSECIKLGENIFGYIVHQLLLAKYPLPELSPPADIPKVDVAAAVLGVFDAKVYELLQKILLKKEVIVIDLKTAIDYCLEAYRNETTREVDTELDKATKKTKANRNQKPRKEKGSKSGKGSKSRRKSEKSEQLPVEVAPKETQTPRIYPCEEIVLSPKGNLGKVIFDSLNTGLTLNDYFLVEIVIEYLRSLDKFKGWVLINFPETVQQLCFLEERLTGAKLPEKFYTHPEEFKILEDFEFREDIFAVPSDQHIEHRNSKLIPRPAVIVDRYQFKSYLTSFVNLRQNLNSKYSDTEYITDSKNFVEDFYQELNINNSFTYQEFDFETIGKLVYKILKDDTFAVAIYEQLVNNTLEVLDEKAKKAEQDLAEAEAKLAKGKKGKQNKATKDKKEKKDKKDKSDRKSIARSISAPKSEILKSGFGEIEEEVPPCKPGEQCWEYVKVSQPHDLKVLLATNWEHIEEIFINDFSQIFFLLRRNKKEIIPYVHKIDTFMQEFIARPDNKQEYLHEFQTMYNSIDNDLRDDDEFKAELHCRISEFRAKLWNICDNRMKEAEAERQRIINDFWFSIQCMFLIELCETAVQLELDRCVNSLQIIQDYYTLMVTKKLSENTFQKYSVHSKRSISNDEVNAKIAESFIITDGNAEQKVFEQYLKSILHGAAGVINSWQSQAMSNLHKTVAPYRETNHQTPKKRRGKEPAVTEAQMEVRKNMENLECEWSAAIIGEFFRTNFRTILIVHYFLGNINDALYYGERLFHDIYYRIEQRYEDEVASVDLACRVLARAVEACESIQPRLIFDGPNFYVDKDVLYYPQERIPAESLKERESDTVFMIEQLFTLTKILLDIAPTGSIPERAFTYLLEDLIVELEEDGTNNKLLPPYWRVLSTKDVSKFVSNLFKINGEYIDWKDFIIWNLNVPYPDELQLLHVRQQFRNMDPHKYECVSTEQFQVVTFWFEYQSYNAQDMLRIEMIKNLLSYLFRVSTERINYSALLLYFCKDDDPLMGIVKAFELSMGNLVCWDIETGNKYIELMRKQQKIRRDEVHTRTPTISYSESEDEYIEPTGVDGLGGSDDGAGGDMLQPPPSTFPPSESRTNYSPEEYLFVEDQNFDTVGLPALCYELPLEVLLVIVTSSLPWHIRSEVCEDKSLREHLEDIYENCRNKEFNTVYMHDILHDFEFQSIIRNNSKFYAMNPAEEVRRLVDVCICESEVGSLSEI